jgi:hypothetical protein
MMAAGFGVWRLRENRFLEKILLTYDATGNFNSFLTAKEECK